MIKPLLPEEKLAVLRAADKERKWYSLDDKRVCTVCDRSFRGSQIDIVTDGNGSHHLHCPTPECPSKIDHWFLSELSPNRPGPSPNKNDPYLLFANRHSSDA